MGMLNDRLKHREYLIAVYFAKSMYSRIVCSLRRSDRVIRIALYMYINISYMN